MKTSDVMNAAYARLYGFGGFSSLNEEIIDESGTLINKVKMKKQNDIFVITDHIRSDQSNGPFSILELSANNTELIISIKSTFKIDTPRDELWLYKKINKINQQECSCSTSYDHEKNTINTLAYISFVGGYDIFYQNGSEEPEDEEFYTSSPEIDGCLNLLVQVLNRIFLVSKEFSGVSA